MRLSKIVLRAPSPTLRTAVVTDSTHLIEAEGGLIVARPRTPPLDVLIWSYAHLAEARLFNDENAPQSLQQPTDIHVGWEPGPEPGPLVVEPDDTIPSPAPVFVEEPVVVVKIETSVETEKQQLTPTPPQRKDYGYGRAGGKKPGKYGNKAR